MKKSIDVTNDDEIKAYIAKLLNKEAFDRSGLIYGMGHAVYTKSDPRAEILMACAKDLSIEKGVEDEYELYKKFAKFAPEIIAEKRKLYKAISPNVDFYSGLVYKMLNLPYELYTPIFAVSRIVGWSAHRIEEIQSSGKIIRPAYVNVKDKREYTPLENR
jgi:citrate synthase